MSIHLFFWALLSFVPSEETWISEKHQDRQPVDVNIPIEIINHYGEVSLRQSEDHHFSYLAFVQKVKTDENQVKVRFHKEEGVYKLHVLFPELVKEKDTSRKKGRRVDLAILIPKQMPVAVETTLGKVHGKKIDNPLRVKTTHGDVKLMILNTLQLETLQGEIEVFFLNPHFETSPILTSRIGKLTAYFPKDSKIHVKAQTGGDLTTDYSLKVEGDLNLKIANTIDHQNLTPVILKSAMGSIAIKKF